VDAEELLPDPGFTEFSISEGPYVGEAEVGTDNNAVARYKGMGSTFDMLVARSTVRRQHRATPTGLETLISIILVVRQ